MTPEKFKIIHLDFTGAGALPVTREGNREILMIVDRYSSWLVAVPVENGTAKTVVRILIERWFPYYGTPDIIITDRAQTFRSGLMQELGERYEVKVHHTS